MNQTIYPGLLKTNRGYEIEKIPSPKAARSTRYIAPLKIKPIVYTKCN